MNKDRANRNILQFKNGFKVFHVKNEGICIAPTFKDFEYFELFTQSNIENEGICRASTKGANRTIVHCDAELRNVKSFTRNKTFKPNFTPRKST